MLMHLHKNYKHKLYFINSFEFFNQVVFILYNFFFLLFTLFAFSIAQAQTSAKQRNFEKDMHELLNERSAIQTDFARQHDFENDLVEEIELVEEIKTDFPPEKTAFQNEIKNRKFL